ncbi:Terminase [Magnetospirillum molischianum DSM 120]|uniref:Terminase n=2 Tax=Magnetospirillum molischianum TaxID=1083 RepID=H8FUY6_MAGML|nr:Terminase [Magnetospirillum molischianum DSM 120]
MPLGGEQFGAWFDHKAADAAVAFFTTYLRHTEAEWYNRPFVLTPWQTELVRQIFGWKRGDKTRLIRQVYLEVPRKNGKTEFAAGLSLLVLVADSEFGGQGYSMAVNKEQAGIVFKKAGVMAALSPALSKVLEVYTTSIYCPELISSFQPLSRSAGSKHGFSPNFAIADELHEWPDGALHDVVHKGTAARRQPLEILITTAGSPGVGYGWELHEYAEQVLAGAIIDPTFLARIFAADPSDDWTSPATWAKANPNYGISVKPDYLASEVAKAQGNTRKIGDFKRYHLNIWNDQATGGLPMEAWAETPVQLVTLESLRGRRCWGGLDLSSTTDITALSLVAESLTVPGGYDAWWHFWIPADGLEERCKRDRVPFDRWIDAGWVTATEGNIVDYDVVRATITGAVEHDQAPSPALIEIVDLVELAIDRWNATQITTQLTTDGVVVVPFGQGFASMSAPTKELERLITGRLFNHGGNPVARWMAGCTRIQADTADNIKPVKPDRRKSIKRIDGIVAAIMALGRAIAPPDEDEPETYEYTGM